MGSGVRPLVRRPSRRRLIVGAAIGLASAALVAFPLRRLVSGPSDPFVDVGPLDGYPIGRTVRATLSVEDSANATPAGQTAVWVRRGTVLEVWAATCPHASCDVDWLDGPQLFACPCHGGLFYADGEVAAGPPPRPLPKHANRVERGRLLVQSRPRRGE